ncbi:MAG: hypothetical protein NWR47_04100, partial [Aestuariivirgaceae bacterium]|nr:hypothetical protein [Aestuariivirgaceae bacterium]
MRLPRLFSVCFLLLAMPAGAEETVAPQAAQSAMPQGSYLGQPRDSYQIFLFGDALADGVLGSLRTAVEGDALLKVDGRTQDESGLARPDIHDWVVALPKIQESQRMEFILTKEKQE